MSHFVFYSSWLSEMTLEFLFSSQRWCIKETKEKHCCCVWRAPKINMLHNIAAFDGVCVWEEGESERERENKSPGSWWSHMTRLQASLLLMSLILLMRLTGCIFKAVTLQSIARNRELFFFQHSQSATGFCSHTHTNFLFVSPEWPINGGAAHHWKSGSVFSARKGALEWVYLLVFWHCYYWNATFDCISISERSPACPHTRRPRHPLPLVTLCSRKVSGLTWIDSFVHLDLCQRLIQMVGCQGCCEDGGLCR